MGQPSDTDLAQSLRLVRAVNALRVTAGVGWLAQIAPLDHLAWTQVEEMSGWWNRPATNSCGGREVPASKAGNAGLRSNGLVEFWAFKVGPNAPGLPVAWSATVKTFTYIVLGEHLRHCGAAHHKDSYALILATK